MLQQHHLTNYIIMKKICLILFVTSITWCIQTAGAQTQDTTNNKVEIKKKVKKGAHGRTVTKIKMEGSGTAGAISGAADGAVTGHLPEPAKQTPAPPPPSVVIVHDTVKTQAPAPAPAPTPKTTEVTTTTTEVKPVVTTSSTTHVVAHKATGSKKPVHVYHRVYKKTPVAATKTTTTTTVKKTE